MNAIDPRGRLIVRREAGFSLVEMMVSLAIGLVIIAAMVALFVNSSRSNRELARANSLIENGRVAIQVLEEDVVHAGYWGVYVPAFDDLTSEDAPVDTPTLVPDPCQEYDPADAASWPTAYRDALVGIGLQVYEMTAAPPAPICDTVVTDAVPDTDILVVRHLETCVPGEPTGGGDCPAVEPDSLYFQGSSCNTEETHYVLSHTGFTLTQLDCATDAELRKFVSDIYYVRDYAVTEGDGIPTLVRAQFDPAGGAPEHAAAEPLVENIQSFRVELGVDNVSKTGDPVDYGEAIVWEDDDNKDTPTNRGDGVPDGDFVRCTVAAPCGVDELMNVTAVRLYVLAASPEPSPGHVEDKTYQLGSADALGPFDDGIKRHVFSTTIRLPNIAGRRVTP
jgi:type IV pilus assembly protein PilW